LTGGARWGNQRIVAYEFYLLPAPAGADVEEAGEALLARLMRFEETRVGSAALPEVVPVANALRATDAALETAPPAPESAHPARPLPVIILGDAMGLEVTLGRSFARVRVPFEHRGDAARAVFDRAFRILTSAASATGWRAYDPQDGQELPLGDDGRESSLLIYLTAMDQIRPAGAR
jgi:hypothetical protein